MKKATCKASVCTVGNGTGDTTGNIAATTDCSACLAATFAVAGSATCSPSVCLIDFKIGTAKSNATATADCTACIDGETSIGGVVTTCTAEAAGNFVIIIAMIFLI